MSWYMTFVENDCLWWLTKVFQMSLLHLLKMIVCGLTTVFQMSLYMPFVENDCLWWLTKVFQMSWYMPFVENDCLWWLTKVFQMSWYICWKWLFVVIN